MIITHLCMRLYLLQLALSPPSTLGSYLLLFIVERSGSHHSSSLRVDGEWDLIGYRVDNVGIDSLISISGLNHTNMSSYEALFHLPIVGLPNELRVFVVDIRYMNVDCSS